MNKPNRPARMTGGRHGGRHRNTSGPGNIEGLFRRRSILDGQQLVGETTTDERGVEHLRVKYAAVRLGPLRRQP